MLVRIKQTLFLVQVGAVCMQHVRAVFHHEDREDAQEDADAGKDDYALCEADRRVERAEHDREEHARDASTL